MISDFKTRVYGKWILAGEHSVLRGVTALVFPLSSCCLELTYSDQVSLQNPTDKHLSLQLSGAYGQELQLLFWGVFEKACDLKNINRDLLQGHVHLQSGIPIGAGLGASAALCVAVTQWLGALGFVSESDYYEFAKNLENLFHGESSGVDIAVVLSGQGLLFSRSGQREKFAPQWQPRWAISYCGQRGATMECVQKVKGWIEKNPSEGQHLDKKMQEAVELAHKALQLDEIHGLDSLVKALNVAKDCFDQWGLTEGAAQSHMQWLLQQGALAVKPTGSGGGGYILSLWKDWPKESVKQSLIEC
ncbi:MAG: mevalonate kinase family protein [Pseudobdellovibrionaceae bacterium]